jgi:acetyl-CoA carboxylase biotin carboxyl carrier protein
MAEEVRAEMVANVWKVLVAEGDEVADGDTLVILESMKMEIPVSAPEDGVLAELLTAEGTTVTEGSVLARMKV